MKKLLIYTDTAWALGQFHTGLASALELRGWQVSLRSWGTLTNFYVPGSPELTAVVREAENVGRALTVVVGAQALLAAGVPREKIVVVAHAEEDIAMQKDFAGFAAYAVISDSLACSSLALGISRVPDVVRVGVDFERYSKAPPVESLKTIGYGSILKRVSALANVDIKRGHLAEKCARDAGLPFKVAYSPEKMVPWQEMPEFYGSVDAVLVPSLQEGDGMPVLEAPAAGRLLIGTPAGHFPRLANEGLGILAPLGERAFCEFVGKRLAFYKCNPEAFREQCLRGQEAARGRDWRKVVGDWIELLS